MAQGDVALHRAGAQVQVAVGEPCVLLGVCLLVDHEGKDLAPGKDDDPRRLHLDCAGRHVRVRHRSRARTDRSLNRDAVLELQLLTDGAQLGRCVRIHHDLGDPVAVPQVEEPDAAVVTVPMHPSVERHRGPGIAGAQRSAGH